LYDICTHWPSGTLRPRVWLVQLSRVAGWAGWAGVLEPPQLALPWVVPHAEGSVQAHEPLLQRDQLQLPPQLS
jgi:hypothetical protein